MVKRIDGMRIFSALEDLTSYPLKYLLIIKNKDIVLSEMVDKLSKQNLDGWFTSIFNCARTEVGLINNGNVFEIIETKPIKRDWRNGSWISSKKNSIKTWGTNYPFSFIERPIVFNLNEKYKKVIEKYIEYEKTSHKHLEFLFIHILQYSRFT